MHPHLSRLVAASLMALAGLALTPAVALAEPVAAEAPVAGTNAAPRYWQAMYLLDNAMKPNPDLDLGVGDASIGVIDENKALALRPMVEESREAMRLFIEASRIGPCDFVGDSLTKDGPHAVLPHFAPLRRCVQMMIASAVIDAKDGKAAQSAESLAAVLRTTRHMQSDGVLLSSLVSLGTFQLCAAAINWGLDRGHFGEAEKATIAAALQGLPNDDPFAVVASIRGERDNFLGWMRREYAPGKELSPAASEFLKSFGSSGCDPNALRIVTDTIEHGRSIEPYILLTERYYNDALASWNTPNADAAIASLGKHLDDGSYGPLSKFVTPAFGHVLKLETKARTSLRLLQARVRQ